LRFIPCDWNASHLLDPVVEPLENDEPKWRSGCDKMRLKFVIQRNILFSSIALMTGFGALTVLATLEWIANADATEATYPLRIWSSFVISFYNILSVTSIHFMTTGWLPDFIKKDWSDVIIIRA
jgi:hypothetical protein